MVNRTARGSATDVSTASSRRHVAVTGAASGMGRATVVAAAQRGYSVSLADVDSVGLQQTLALVDSIGVPAFVRTVDVADRDAVAAWLTTGVERHGALWGAAAAAGILRQGFADDVDDDHHEAIWRINYLGVVHTAVEATRHMTRGGRIVLWSSASALGGAPGSSAYGASKAAVDSFTASFALEVAHRAITVNAIRPGWVETPMLAHLTAADLERERLTIPLGRWGKPEDIAAAALFLMEEDAGWITGTVINVDGGSRAAVDGYERVLRALPGTHAPAPAADG